MSNTRSRGWIVVINNWTEEDYQQLCGQDPKYFVVGKEVGKCGTPHLQSFLYFKHARSFKSIKEKFPRAHIEMMQGTPAQAAEYCKKDGDFVEDGVCPVTDKEKGDREKKRFERAWELAKEGNMEEIDADIRTRYYGTLKKIRLDYQINPSPIDRMDFHWYYGASGTGKSRKARDDNPGYYIKPLNKWWDGYVDQPCVIIEEWDPETSKWGATFLKQWCDHHSFAAEIKGGCTCIRPPKIIVTSNYSLEECFGHDVEGCLNPFKRRFKVLHFSESFNGQFK